MTSDGISAEDWDNIREVAAVIANAACADDNVLYESAISEMENALKDLKAKYGALPSIIATEAEYVADPREKIRLLRQALKLAECQADGQNQKLIIHSLADAFIDEIQDRELAVYWMNRFAQIAVDVESQTDLAGLRDDFEKRFGKSS